MRLRGDDSRMGCRVQAGAQPRQRRTVGSRMTNLELRAFLAAHDLRALRRACGFRASTVAAALGIGPRKVTGWESGRLTPHGGLGERYARVVAGMARHLEVPRDEEAAS